MDQPVDAKDEKLRTESAVDNARAQNARLVAKLSRTQDAQLKRNVAENALRDSNGKLSKLDQHIELLHRLTIKMQNKQYRHESFKDKLVAKWASIKSKTTSNALIEESEKIYLSQLQKELDARKQRDTILANNDKLRLERDAADVALREHQEAQQELEVLYERIFGGATPDFPAEDKLEGELEAVLQWFNQAKEKSDMALDLYGRYIDATLAIDRALEHFEYGLAGKANDEAGPLATGINPFFFNIDGRPPSAVYQARGYLEGRAELRIALENLQNTGDPLITRQVDEIVASNLLEAVPGSRTDLESLNAATQQLKTGLADATAKLDITTDETAYQVSMAEVTLNIAKGELFNYRMDAISGNLDEKPSK